MTDTNSTLSATTTPTAGVATPPSLYERLGGTEGIRAIVDDIFQAHLDNPLIRARYLPLAQDPARASVVKGHLCTFLEAGGGGPAQYTGRSMPDTHRGMNISEQELVAAIDDILAVLERHAVDPQTRNEVLSIAYSLKAEIVRL